MNRIYGLIKLKRNHIKSIAIKNSLIDQGNKNDIQIYVSCDHLTTIYLYNIHHLFSKNAYWSYGQLQIYNWTTNIKHIGTTKIPHGAIQINFFMFCLGWQAGPWHYMFRQKVQYQGHDFMFIIQNMTMMLTLTDNMRWPVQSIKI